MECNTLQKLPDDAPSLIRLALSDLEKVENDPAFAVDMNVWLRRYSSCCRVCLAGSVMANTLGSEMESPSLFDHDTKHKLLALDHFRNGYLRVGLRLLGVPAEKTLVWEEPFIVPAYEDERDGFHRAMHDIADVIEERLTPDDYVQHA